MSRRPEEEMNGRVRLPIRLIRLKQEEHERGLVEGKRTCKKQLGSSIY